MPRQALITSWDEVPIVMDLPYAARILAKTPDRLARLSQQGKFPAFRDGKFWRVEKETLREYIKMNSVTNSRTPQSGTE